MRKRILLLLVVLSVLVLRADLMYYLHWDTSGYAKLTLEEGKTVKTIALYATNGTETHQLEAITIDDFVLPAKWASGRWETNISAFVSPENTSDYWFYVNLLGDEGVDGVAETLYSGEVANKWSYADLLRDNFISTESSVFHPYWSTIVPVPEPSGGVLALLGAAALLLKRRKNRCG